MFSRSVEGHFIDDVFYRNEPFYHPGPSYGLISYECFDIRDVKWSISKHFLAYSLHFASDVVSDEERFDLITGEFRDRN